MLGFTGFCTPLSVTLHGSCNTSNGHAQGAHDAGKKMVNRRSHLHLLHLHQHRKHALKPQTPTMICLMFLVSVV